MQNFQERPSHDEISLVDLTATLIRRRRIFCVTLFLVTVLGVAFALMQPAKYEYVTLIDSAQKADNEYVQKPSVTITTAQSRWIPEIAAGYQAANNERLPFRIKLSNPANTGLIRIASETAQENKALVDRTHQELAEQIIKRQQQLLKIEAESLEERIASMDLAIESLKESGDSDSTGVAVATTIQKRAELKGDLKSLKPAETLLVSRQSLDQQGMSKRFIVIVAVVLGSFLGVFLVFLTEFASRVRESLVQGSEE